MMETGATQGGLRKKKIFALGAIFLGVQICMQTCGILLTWWIKQYLQHCPPWSASTKRFM